VRAQLPATPCDSAFTAYTGSGGGRGEGGGRDVEAAWLDIHLGLYSVRYCSYLYIQKIEGYFKIKFTKTFTFARNRNEYIVFLYYQKFVDA
jgi:hypothetical protein